MLGDKNQRTLRITQYVFSFCHIIQLLFCIKIDQPMGMSKVIERRDRLDRCLNLNK